MAYKPTAFFSSSREMERIMSLSAMFALVYLCLLWLMWHIKNWFQVIVVVHCITSNLFSRRAFFDERIIHHCRAWHEILELAKFSRCSHSTISTSIHNYEKRDASWIRALNALSIHSRYLSHIISVPLFDTIFLHTFIMLMFVCFFFSLLNSMG